MASQAWQQYAQMLLPALVPAHAGSGVPAWVLLGMAAHESGVPPVSYSSLVGINNPWGIDCNGQAGSCAVYPSLAAAGEALPDLLPANVLAEASNPTLFMRDLQEDDWSGSTTGDYAQSILTYWGPLAQAALTAIGVDPVTGIPVAIGPPAPGTPGTIAAARSTSPWLVAGAVAVVALGVVGIVVAVV